MAQIYYKTSVQACYLYCSTQHTIPIVIHAALTTVNEAKPIRK